MKITDLWDGAKGNMQRKKNKQKLKNTAMIAKNRL